jgi:hypothetical protein
MWTGGAEGGWPIAEEKSYMLYACSREIDEAEELGCQKN